MTQKIKENIELHKDDVESFENLISAYCESFVSAREVMEKEKMLNGGVLGLERLLEIFSDFNTQKKYIIETVFGLDQEKQERIKKVDLPIIFSKAVGPQKRAIGEIKAGIENNLTTKI